MLAGKRGLVAGVLNDRSIGWAVAQQWRAAGCEVALAYQDERARPNIERLVARGGGDTAVTNCLVQCDATDDAQLRRLAKALDRRFDGQLHAVMHSMAYAPSEAFGSGSLLSTTRENWHDSMDASVYSLLALTKATLPMLRAAARGGGASVSTLSYIGAQRVVPNYLVMGPAKAALEATARALASELGRESIRVNVLRYATHESVGLKCP